MLRFLFTLFLLFAPPTGPLAADPLIELGEQLFMEEDFDGNGRTCGTCHDPGESFGLTPQGVAVIFAADPLDPLFIAENDPALSTLENRVLRDSRKPGGNWSGKLQRFGKTKRICRRKPFSAALKASNRFSRTPTNNSSA